MLASLQRHPFAVEAFFRWSLVLTYALPPRALRAFLPAGLELDTYGAGEQERAFLAVALVQTEGLRPKGFPRALGRNFFLSGYRVFARFVRPGKATLRGLKIIRSDADRRTMVHMGNVFTHYRYRLARVESARSGDTLTVDVRTEDSEADLHVEADLAVTTALPDGSPFRSLEEARHFAGPLPYTFDADSDAGKMLVVRGVRAAWDPRPVRIVAQRSTFLARPELASEGPQLANAFFVENIPYSWKSGVLEDLT